MNVRVLYIVSSAIISAYVGWEWGILLRGTESVLSSIIDCYAILAGVLVAVISIIGDPSMLIPGNWRVGFEHAKDIQNRIARFAHLFTVYLLALTFAIIALFLDKAEIAGGNWVFSTLMAVTVFGGLMSIPLPYVLMSIQKERMSEEVKRREARTNG